MYLWPDKPSSRRRINTFLFFARSCNRDWEIHESGSVRYSPNEVRESVSPTSRPHLPDTRIRRSDNSSPDFLSAGESGARIQDSSGNASCPPHLTTARSGRKENRAGGPSIPNVCMPSTRLRPRHAASRRLCRSQYTSRTVRQAIDVIVKVLTSANEAIRRAISVTCAVISVAKLRETNYEWAFTVHK